MRIGFSTSKKTLSGAIRWFTHSKASHSYILFTAEEEQLIVEANVHGVVCEHYEKFKTHNTIVAEFELSLTTEEEHKLVAYALKQLAQPYDFLAIFGFAWVLLNKMVGRKTKQPFRNRSAYMCSELVICALQSINFPLSHFMDREVTSPEDIIEFLDSHPRAKFVSGTLKCKRH